MILEEAIPDGKQQYPQQMLIFGYDRHDDDDERRKQWAACAALLAREMTLVHASLARRNVRQRTDLSLPNR